MMTIWGERALFGEKRLHCGGHATRTGTYAPAPGCRPQRKGRIRQRVLPGRGKESRALMRNAKRGRRRGTCAPSAGVPSKRAQPNGEHPVPGRQIKGVHLHRTQKAARGLRRRPHTPTVCFKQTAQPSRGDTQIRGEGQKGAYGGRAGCGVEARCPGDRYAPRPPCGMCKPKEEAPAEDAANRGGGFASTLCMENECGRAETSISDKCGESESGVQTKDARQTEQSTQAFFIPKGHADTKPPGRVRDRKNRSGREAGKRIRQGGHGGVRMD